MAPSPATLYAEQSPTQEQNIKICNTCYQRLPTAEFEKANHGTSLRGDCNECRRSKRKIGYQKPVFLTPLTSKSCAKCGIEKSASEFTYVAANPSGLHSYCKDCQRNAARARVAATAETRKLALRVEYENMEPHLRPIPKVCGSTTCHLVGEVQPPENFDKSRIHSSGLRMDCRLCELERRRKNPKEASVAYHSRWYQEHKDELSKMTKAWREANPEHVKAKYVKRRFRQYGATPEWYEKTLKEQQGGCAICGTRDPKSNGNTFHVDHDHSCCTKECSACANCRRGLLCGPCNTRLGLLEMADWVKQAKSYLAKYSRKNATGNEEPSLFDAL